MRSLNKEKIRKNYEVKKFELSKEHNKQQDELNIDLARRNMVGQGPAIKQYLELYENHVKELGEIYLNSLLQSIDGEGIIDENLKICIIKESDNFIDREIRSKNNSLISYAKARNKIGAIEKSISNQFTERAFRLKKYFSDKLIIKIDDLNRKILDEKNTKNQLKKDKVTQSINWIKNNRILSIVVLFGIIIIAIGSFTDSLTKIKSFLDVSYNNKNNIPEITIHIKLINQTEADILLNPLCKYEIGESVYWNYIFHSQGRILLNPISNSISSTDSILIASSEVSDFILKIPNPEDYQKLIKKGSANIYIEIRNIENSKGWEGAAPFETESLKKYYLPIVLKN